MAKKKGRPTKLSIRRARKRKKRLENLTSVTSENQRQEALSVQDERENQVAKGDVSRTEEQNFPEKPLPEPDPEPLQLVEKDGKWVCGKCENHKHLRQYSEHWECEICEVTLQIPWPVDKRPQVRIPGYEFKGNQWMIL